MWSKLEAEVKESTRIKSGSPVRLGACAVVVVLFKVPPTSHHPEICPALNSGGAKPSDACGVPDLVWCTPPSWCVHKGRRNSGGRKIFWVSLCQNNDYPCPLKLLNYSLVCSHIKFSVPLVELAYQAMQTAVALFEKLPVENEVIQTTSICEGI